MIQEDYCSFEVAKLLKEKGFDEFCLTSYNAFLSNHKVEESKASEWGKANQIYRPTHQMAMKWLREVFHIHIRLIHSADESYKFEIYPMAGKYRCNYFEDYTYYSSYEEAVEAALKYALKKLIV